MADLFNSLIEYMTFSHIMVFIYILNTIISLGLIFVDTNKSASAIMAWIMILYILPAVGLFMYLILSQNIARMKIFRMTADEEAGLGSLLEWQKEAVRKGISDNPEDETYKWRNMIMLNLDYANSLLIDCKDIELIYDGREMFDRLLEDIRNAKYTIKLCYYIIRDDDTGKELIDLLTRKAQEGVKVRLLIDALGSRSIGYSELRAFKKAGGRYAYFFKPLIRHMYFRINYRNHRKLAVIDNETGYIGGFNIADEYLGKSKKFGYWRDTQLIIKGNVIAALNERFYQDWRYASKEKLDIVEQSIKYAYKSDLGRIPVQIVSCGPESDKEEIKRSMMKMITGARESIYIQTPYLVPDTPMLDSLAMAARSGLDVRIMIPAMPDHPFVYRTTLYNAGKLIKEGAHIYIYRNGFLHAKTLTVDGEVCTAGSCNFDIRSFRLNFESNAFIYDCGVAGRMNAQFEEDMKLSREYTQEDRDNISLYERMAESISRLLTEIL